MEERPIIVGLESADLENALEHFGAEEPRFSPVARSKDPDDDDPLGPFSSEHRLVLVETAKEPLDDDLLPVPTSESPARASSSNAARLEPRRVAVAVLVGCAVIGSAVAGVVVRGWSGRAVTTTEAVVQQEPIRAAVAPSIENRNVDLSPARAPDPQPIMALATRIPDRPAAQPAPIVPVRPQPVAARPSVGIIPASPRGSDAASARPSNVSTEIAPVPVAPIGAANAAPNLSSVPAGPAPPSVPPAVAAPVPSSTTAPAAAAVAAGAPVSAAVVENGAIQNVLNRYRNAFSALDVADARAVWPSVDAKALARAFDQLEEQDVRFDTCQISVAGARATASCGGTARYVPKIGSRSEHTDSHRWKFSLRRISDAWLIESVDSR